MSTQIECSICYDAIGDKNSCVTPCGHTFCFNCMMQSLAMKNECPCCRAALTKEKEEEEESEYESDEEDGVNVDPELLMERFLINGRTMMDLVSVMGNTFSRADPKYTDEYIGVLCTEYETLLRTLDEEHYDAEGEEAERESMEQEDTNAAILDCEPENCCVMRQLMDDTDYVQIPYQAPTDEQLKSDVIHILRTRDLNVVSLKNVREMMEAKYGCCLKAKKSLFKNTLHQFIFA